MSARSRRQAVLGIALALLPACGTEEPPSFEGRDAAGWELYLLNPATRDDARTVLQRGGVKALPVLKVLLNSPEPPVRGSALEAIIGLGPEAADAVGALSALLDDEAAGARGLAALALGRIGPKAGAALGRLDKLLGDSAQRVRVAAALATWRIAHEGKRAMREMMLGLSGDARIRAMVAEGLGEFGAAAVEPLIGALKDKDAVVRMQAGAALGEIGAAARPARPALERVRDSDEDPFVRATALTALQRIPAK